MRTRPLALLVAIAGAACGDPVVAPRIAVVAGEVRAARVSGGVEIANGTDRGIAHAVFNPNWLGLIGTCADPAPTCVRLAAGARVVVPEREFLGWEGQPAALRRLTVLWWRVDPAPTGGHVASSVQQIALIE